MANVVFINLDVDKIINKFYIDDLEFCRMTLKQEFKIQRDDNNQIMLLKPSIESLGVIEEILLVIQPKYKFEIYRDAELLLTKQAFESLMNSARCNDIQDAITFRTNILTISYDIMKFMLSKNETFTTPCLKMELQFLFNLIISNAETKVVVWRVFAELIIESLSRKDVVHISVLILHNVFYDHPDFIPKDPEFFCKLIELLDECVDNVPLLIEMLINKYIFADFYNSLYSESRVKFLASFHLLLFSEIVIVVPDFIMFLSEQFKRKSECILETAICFRKSLEPLEVAKLLDCLSFASSKDEYLIVLQQDTGLLTNSVSLLRSIHEAGKSGENNFTSLSKLANTAQYKNVIEEHPAFGFKAKLIQLIANLCYMNEKFQNKIRDLHIMEILLDCANIDARNPLIIQWVVLAIRNLCENNVTNQEIISNMSKIGVINSATLAEMGLALSDDGENKITILPLNNK